MIRVAGQTIAYILGIARFASYITSFEMLNLFN